MVGDGKNIHRHHQALHFALALPLSGLALQILAWGGRDPPPIGGGPKGGDNGPMGGGLARDLRQNLWASLQGYKPSIISYI